MTGNAIQDREQAGGGTYKWLAITRASRHCHELGYQVPHSTKEFHKFSFYPRTIGEWNALPTHIPESSSLESFKSNLAIWSNNTI